MTRAILLFLLLTISPAMAQDAPEPVKQEDILPYLEQVIAFNHAVVDAEQLPDNPRETILKNSIKANAKKALQKSFEFASAQAQLLNIAAPAEVAPEQAESRRGRLLKAMADTQNSIDDLQTRLSSRSLSSGTRERLNGELKLARAQADLIRTMMDIFKTDSKDAGSLSDQIAVLSRTEISDASEAAAGAKDTAPKVIAAQPVEETDSGDGMLKLSTSLFSYSRKQSQIEDLIEQNKALTERSKALTSSIRTSLKEAISAGKALSSQNSNDAKSMVAYRKSLNELLARYKGLSATIIPIGEMNVTLESTLRSLQEWDKFIGEDWAGVFRHLLLRLVILSIAIAIPLVISSVAHRATLRYVKDPKRQKQLSIVRRIVLAAVLAFVILANFITEFGSLATFAGFITAGLAVALQTVLVSLVAHFFFFGRYGIRAGDRVTISDVTGEVIQVGVLRLYIRELMEKDGSWVPSGKMVAFPNSILFQPAAFYKHVNEGAF